MKCQHHNDPARISTPTPISNMEATLESQLLANSNSSSRLTESMSLKQLRLREWAQVEKEAVWAEEEARKAVDSR